MREILFRGKRPDNGEWVEGYVYRFHPICRIRHWLSLLGKYGDADVDPATVGQYTGLNDKNGKRIFEGDVVAFKRENALGYTTRRVGEVKYYDKLPIFYIMASTGDAWDWCYCEDVEVIGNIHDNPELLGGNGNG